MGLSEKAKENKIKYNIEYHKQKYKRIPLDVTLEKYEQIKEFSEKNNQKINTFIKSAIDEKIFRDSKKE